MENVQIFDFPINTVRHKTVLAGADETDTSIAASQDTYTHICLVFLIQSICHNILHLYFSVKHHK